MPRAKKSTPIKLKVANTEFQLGDILEVTPKLDRDAPSGFQQFGTSKLLMKGIAEPFSISFDEDLQLWDTGFDEIHPSNNNIPIGQKSTVVKSYIEHIKEPYEEKFRKDLDSTNDEFWSTYIVDVYKGRRFDTNNEKDLLDLYLTLKNGKVCEEKETNYHLRKANYNITNVKQVQTVQEKKEDTIFTAMGTLKVKLDAFDPKKDNDDIYTILEWINIANIRGSDKETVKKVILKQFTNEKTGYDTCRRFLNACEMFEDKTKKEVMENFSVLSKLSHKRKIEFKKRQYFINGQLLGNNLKEAAENIKNDDELRNLVTEAYKSIA